MKIYFIGAGPGDPELLTLKGKKIIETADIIIYAGSLVNPEVLKWKNDNTVVHDSSSMNLEEMCDVFENNKDQKGIIARLHTGDPGLYSAIGEQIRFCHQKKIPFEIIPGVSSFAATAASLGIELTLPGISQSVVITRKAGRTPVPKKESLKEYAKTGCILAIFLSCGMAKNVMEEIKPYYDAATPAAVVYKASWPDEKIMTGTISTIAVIIKKEQISRQAIIIVGKVINSRDFSNSKLYAHDFSHGYRQQQEKT